MKVGEHLRSNVVAYLALFVALGGSAYAAVKLEKNSVKSKNIAPGQVKNSDLADAAVTSPKVADGSLESKDFAAGQLPSGERGPQGLQGQQGTQGIQGIQGVPGPSTGPASGVLSGDYPGPAFSASINKLVPIATFEFGVTGNLTNRVQRPPITGFPTLAKGAAGAYTVTFPGYNVDGSTISTCTANGTSGGGRYVVASPAGGNLLINTINGTTGLSADSAVQCAIFEAPT